MKAKNIDTVISEIRLARFEVAKERAANPIKFHKESMRMIQRFGMKISQLRPMSLTKLKCTKKLNDAA